jgi:hypothetical protein
MDPKKPSMKVHYKPSALLPLVLFVAITSFAQTTPDEKTAREQQVKTIVEKKDFRFVAQTMTPARGRLRPITDITYTIAVSPDSLSADLPFFGRAYTAPVGASGGGINFKTTDFEYASVPKRRGGWDIVLTPKGTDVRKISLLVGAGGNTTAIVVSNSRETISYNGYITAR